MQKPKVPVRSGLEVRIYLTGGMFTRRRFFKYGQSWGVTHSFNGSKERFKNVKEAQAALDELIDRGGNVYNVRGDRIWPELKSN